MSKHFVSFATFLWIFVSFANAGPLLQRAEDPATQLFNLGTVEGKSFFAHTGQMNWTAGRSFCHSLGMKMGTIATVVQLNFLANKYDSVTFKGSYWTSGSDAKSYASLVWGSGQTLINTLVFWDLKPQSVCVVYNAATDLSNGKLGSIDCDSTKDMGILCET